MKTLLRQIGYEIRRVPKNRKEAPGFVLYSYLNKDGSFAYDKYRQIQVDGNKRP